MADTKTDADVDTTTSIMDSLLKEQEFSKLRQKIKHEKGTAQDSNEKERQSSLDTPDPSILSTSKKREKLEHFWKQDSRQRRRRRKQLTKSDVRNETARILEEFLQNQLRQQDVQTSHKYQRVVEVDVTETTTPSGGSSGYMASKSSLLREDSIPFADESDTELKRAESLPHDEIANIESMYAGKIRNKVSIKHEKSKSAPYAGTEDDYVNFGDRYGKKVRPTPPPPPGTPHTPSEKGSNRSSKEDVYVYQSVPYTGERTSEKSRAGSHKSNEGLKEHVTAFFGAREDERSTEESKPDSIFSSYTSSTDNNLDSSNLKKESKSDSSHKHGPDSVTSLIHRGDKVDKLPFSQSQSNDPSSDSSNQPVVRPKKFKNRKPTSLSLRHKDCSDSDTDSVKKPDAHGRKKKSMFKKARHQISTILRLKKPKASPDELENDEVDHSPKQKHRRQMEEKDADDDRAEDEADMFESDGFDVHEFAGNNVMEERHIHTDKHIHQTHSGKDRKTVLRTENTMESIDVIDHQDPSKNRHYDAHLRVRESSHGGFMGRLRSLTSRNKVKGSKSQQFPHSNNDNDGPHGDYSQMVSLPGTSGGYNPEENRINTYEGGFSTTNIRRRQPGAGISEIHTTQVTAEDEIKRHSSHLDIIDPEGNMIDRIYYDTTEDDVLPRNKSFDYRKQMEITERRFRGQNGDRLVRDCDTHSHMDMDLDTDGPVPEGPDISVEMEDDEDLYGKIAERLAHIGDNFLIERDIKSPCVSPRRKPSPEEEQKMVSESDTMEKSTLTPLEQEIRDELRAFADRLDDGMASNARQAAIRISGIVTYKHFQDVIEDTVGKEDGWAQIAAVFRFTKTAIQAAGAGGSLALSIKENSLRFIEDRFADWIVGQGGWDSMLSDDESDVDSELD
ncbi:uncharacterized protein LOC128238246 [Mya arenaria]|uniref:uncharacterized protein LOC128238246 n=1 Tax=Mya arenaria TaxID=6604 RepID=UPI0022E06644|nr:uncharacterized protein LOC128238246 [Mya arenaria]XP_052809904.1 uncharacterized protein LOC128238246 [Mya arenaria]XP_052809905.1 uncharacterized protein LOC128238246 [Mya arenaria]